MPIIARLVLLCAAAVLAGCAKAETAPEGLDPLRAPGQPVIIEHAEPSRLPWLIGGVAILVGVVAGGALTITQLSRRRPRTAAAPPPPPGDPLRPALAEVAASGASAAISEQIDRLLAGPAGRDELARACVRFRDQLAGRFPAQADRLAAALATAGIREVRAEGQPFDGRVHEAVDTTPTDDPRLHDTVSATIRTGYVDGERVLRVPRVVVYRWDGAS
ncbi:nucleotide exchange factor GrpE [Acrocarpospora catenulata]|uniref:nucleotide exchange factor GrpE n=1 Tax=Acrocarpospora catenulata TaxID=2836182 RepID=UPI001BDA3CBE|nr:nucleotide exchange factor GrpE [Acrocarpospora catenulata]